MNTCEETYRAHSMRELLPQLLPLFCFLLNFASGLRYLDSQGGY